ncbi:MAG: hypothetical protein GFH25_541180n325 [Chloroflexi bacterium AL-N10]|nr:hypothetical protein [Chloroflexi bacterium AL-N1]NOK65360.1 hypothetical protein [Chloroflexi bacterium AL-N10]NOK72374.1 hypothetical protein [Chloroflexi bacterium AL-N5]NOK87455.1 hypothetical protein [Chloroflexi bacterium AL-N15]
MTLYPRSKTDPSLHLLHQHGLPMNQVLNGSQAGWLSRLTMADEKSFFSELYLCIYELLPHARVDVLVQRGKSMQLYWTSVGAECDPPPQLQSLDDASVWLESDGYYDVLIQPLMALNEIYGWLIVAHGEQAYRPQHDMQPVLDMLSNALAWHLAYAERDRDAKQYESQIRRHEQNVQDAQTVVEAGRDIGKYLSAVVGCAQILQADMPNIDDSELDVLVDAGTDALFVLRRIRAYERERLSEFPMDETSIRLDHLLMESIRIVKPLCRVRTDVLINADIPVSVAEIVGHRNAIRSVLVSIFLTILEYMPFGGLMTVHVVDLPERAVIELVGESTSQLSMLSPEDQRFIAGYYQDMLRPYGGTLKVSTPNNGLSFRIGLPIAVIRERAVGA